MGQPEMPGWCHMEQEPLHYPRVMGWTVTFKTSYDLLTSLILLHTLHFFFLLSAIQGFWCPCVSVFPLIFAIALLLSHKMNMLTACVMFLCLSEHSDAIHCNQGPEMETAYTKFKGCLNKQVIKGALRWTRWFWGLSLFTMTVLNDNTNTSSKEACFKVNIYQE